MTAETIARELAVKTTEIASLPEITMKIISVVQDPRSTAYDLHRIVINDPALSARVLKVVNSAFYGLPGQIASVDRAIMMLGLNAVKNIAIAASLTRMFHQKSTHDDFSGKDLWTHSVAVGACNKLVTAEMGSVLPDEAFLAGLIHDLGLVAILQSRGTRLREIIDHVHAGVPFRQAEMEVIGTDHQHVGFALAEHWKFPETLQVVTGYHHDPFEMPIENRRLVMVTHLSDILCAKQNIGVSVTCESRDDEIAPEILDELQLTTEQLEDISTHIENELEVVRTLIE